MGGNASITKLQWLLWTFFFLTLKIAADCGQNKTMENPPKKKIKQKKERSLNQTSKYLPLNMMDFTKLHVKKIKQIEILQRGMDVVKAMEWNKNYIIEKRLDLQLPLMLIKEFWLHCLPPKKILSRACLSFLCLI